MNTANNIHQGLFSLTSVYLLACAGVVSCVGWTIPPVWLQPTAVGVALGLLFATGLFLGTSGQANAKCAAYSFVVALMVCHSLKDLTDLSLGAARLFATVLVGIGWVSTKLFGRSCWSLIDQRPKQPSIWDILLLTTIIGFAIADLPNISPHPALLRELLFVVAGGTIACWFVIHWIDCGHWTWLRLLRCGLLFGLFWSIQLMLPSDGHAGGMFTGPMAVIWAQMTTVLLTLAVIRTDYLVKTRTYCSVNANLEFQR